MCRSWPLAGGRALFFSHQSRLLHPRARSRGSRRGWASRTRGTGPTCRAGSRGGRRGDPRDGAGPEAMTMRIFLAVFPPPEAQQLAFAYAASHCARAAGDAAGRVSWVKLENLHYTLKFLGELGEDGARRAGEGARRGGGIARGLRRDARRRRRVPERAAGARAVARARSGRARSSSNSAGAWTSRSRSAASIARSAHSARTSRSGECAIPGRTGPPRSRPTPSLAGEPAARFRVGEVRVMKSTLSSGGSIYETLVRAALKG